MEPKLNLETVVTSVNTWIGLVNDKRDLKWAGFMHVVYNLGHFELLCVFAKTRNLQA